jgi:hypothetical protein
LDFGNLDFDVNLIVSDAAFDPNGQYFFDIFDTDGFLGDVMLVNMAYAPFMEVLPRKYRFRILSASMSRFIQLQIADSSGNAVPFLQIANDGNLFVNPISLTSLDQQGTAERYDIIVDFSRFKIGDRLTLVNRLQQTDGRKPDQQLPLQKALARISNDPAVGGILQFRIVSQAPSVDVPGVILHATDPDRSVVPNVLTEQIPIVTPVRERVVQWGRSGSGDSRGSNGQCIPDCPDSASFPWSLIVNGAPGPLHERQPGPALIPEGGRHRALDLYQRRRRLGSPDPSPFRGRHHHEPRQRHNPRDGTDGAKGRLAVASLGSGAIPDSVRGIWRILRQPLPQHGARGLRPVDAHPAPQRGSRIAAGRDHRDPESDARRRGLHDAAEGAISRRLPMRCAEGYRETSFGAMSWRDRCDEGC